MSEQGPIARILRANTRAFSAGARTNQLSAPSFGALVKAVGYFDPHEVTYGLISDIHIDDDPLVRQMILADTLTEEMLHDQRNHRMAPVEIDAIAIGYLGRNNVIIQALPPRPHMGLDPVFLCDQTEVVAFSRDLTFLQILITAGSDFPVDQLITAFLRHSAMMLPEIDRYPYLVDAGREISRLFARDVRRTEMLLSLLKYGWEGQNA